MGAIETISPNADGSQLSDLKHGIVFADSLRRAGLGIDRVSILLLEDDTFKVTLHNLELAIVGGDVQPTLTVALSNATNHALGMLFTTTARGQGRVSEAIKLAHSRSQNHCFATSDFVSALGDPQLIGVGKAEQVLSERPDLVRLKTGEWFVMPPGLEREGMPSLPSKTTETDTTENHVTSLRHHTV